MTTKEKSAKLRSIKGKLKRLHNKILDSAICETDSAGVCIEKCFKVVNLAIEMRILFAQARIIQSTPTGKRFESGGHATVTQGEREYIVNRDGKIVKL